MTSVDEIVEDDWVMLTKPEDTSKKTTFNDVKSDVSRIHIGVENTAVSALGVVGGILQTTGCCMTAAGTTILFVVNK